MTLVKTLSALVFSCSAAFAQNAEPLVFNTTAPRNVLVGAFEAEVQFAQSQIIDARPRAGDALARPGPGTRLKRSGRRSLVANFDPSAPADARSRSFRATTRG